LSPFLYLLYLLSSVSYVLSPCYVARNAPVLIRYDDMPTYEYRCPDGHTFEKFYRKISDAESTVPCPACGKIAERLVSGGAGLVFKGSGFYITDYGKDGKKDERAQAKRSTKGETTPINSPSGGSSDKSAGSSGSGSSVTNTGATSATPPTPAPQPAASSSKSKPSRE
jgi:putative FmdB family regulatory protein